MATDIYNTPVVLPPDGVESNFDPGLTQVQITTFVVFGVAFGLATISLAMRYISTTLIMKKWELDFGGNHPFREPSMLANARRGLDRSLLSHLTGLLPIRGFVHTVWMGQAYLGRFASRGGAVL